MLKNNSIVMISDNTNARRGKIIQILGGSKRKYAFITDLVVLDIITKKRIGARLILQKEIYLAFVSQVKCIFFRKNGIGIRFFRNRAVLFFRNNKEELECLGTRFYGPKLKEYHRVKFSKTLLLSEDRRKFLI